MLKSMLTARQLGIEEWERDALIRVRNSLRNGSIPARLFNMYKPDVNPKCGTAGCIGGWVSHYGRLNNEEHEEFWGRHIQDGSPFAQLFYPLGIEDWTDIAPRTAVRAINNFLYTGKPDWAEAMSHA